METLSVGFEPAPGMGNCVAHLRPRDCIMQYTASPHQRVGPAMRHPDLPAKIAAPLAKNKPGADRAPRWQSCPVGAALCHAGRPSGSQ